MKMSDEKITLEERRKIGVCYQSHLGPLGLGMGITDGDVLEIGVGAFSTPYLHWNCNGLRDLLSVDTDIGWINQFKDLVTESHLFRHVADWDKFFDIVGTKWSLV